MEKECCRCANFTAYYEKAYSCFLRTKFGNCFLKNATVEKHGSCENYRCRSSKKRNKGVVIRELNTSLANISAIKLILEEEDEE